MAVDADGGPGLELRFEVGPDGLGLGAEGVADEVNAGGVGVGRGSGAVCLGAWKIGTVSKGHGVKEGWVLTGNDPVKSLLLQRSASGNDEFISEMSELILGVETLSVFECVGAGRKFGLLAVPEDFYF